jgi:branched-chain amino acid transport system substrate-binding protein
MYLNFLNPIAINSCASVLQIGGLKTRAVFGCVAMACLMHTTFADAQKSGASANTNLAPIYLGQSAVMTGPTQSLGLEARKGIEIALAEINQKGGIQGRMLMLKSLDDQGDALIAAANAKTLINEAGVVGLIGSVGTSSSEATAQVATAEHVALIGPISGSDTLRGAAQPNIFHIRASHSQEVTRLVEQIGSMGMKAVSVVYQNDAFGNSSLANFEATAQKLQLSVASKAVIASGAQANKAAVAAMAAHRAPVIVVLATYDIASDFIKELRAAGNSAMLMTMSVVGAKALNDQLLDEARGMGMSQVMPYPWSAKTPLVSQYHRALSGSGYGEKDYNYSSLEGYVAARIAIEALRKNRKEFTSANFQLALKTLGAVDLGGYMVRLNPQNREGSNFIDMTVISATGRFLK